MLVRLSTSLRWLRPSSFALVVVASACASQSPSRHAGSLGGGGAGAVDGASAPSDDALATDVPILDAAREAAPAWPAADAADAADTVGATPAAGAVGGADATSASSRFPLKVSANGRYLVDRTGSPFRIQGDASWDAHHNLSLAELRTYLDDRQSKGFNALFTYTASSVAYFVGSAAPWAAALGGPSAGAAALPFTADVSGKPWDGDPTFAHHDASFASPNDAFFAWVAQFVDEAAARGMVVMLAPMYLGYGLGASDGWYQTVMNAANTQSVCFAFGQYLATGHGTFTGFKDRPNIIWVQGGDTLPPDGSEGALRALQVLKGMQAAGDTHLETAHWQHDYVTTTQADFAPFMTAYAAYSHGPYPTLGPTYAESRVLYGEATPRPTWLLETNYWGEHGATRAQIRSFEWGSALSTVGGTTFGFGPFWGFATSPDGSHSTPITVTTAWEAAASYAANQYVSKGGLWYRATSAGMSGTTGPTGSATSIADGTVTWSYAGSGGWSALLSDPAVIDMQRMGSFLSGLAWYDLVPSGLAGEQLLIASGGGTYAAWSNGGSEGGGLDWAVSSATPDGTLLVAYVPDAHSGPLAVTLAQMAGPIRARWYDPASGSYAADSSGAGYGLPNTGAHAFTTPGPNAAGSNDWVLTLDVAATGDN